MRIVPAGQFSRIGAVIAVSLAFFADDARSDHQLAEQISIGPAGGNGAIGVDSKAYPSADGSRIFFLTPESLVAADTDSSMDIYERAGGATTLISAGGNGAFDVTFRAASDDGSHVIFETAEPLSAADADSSIDVYDRSGGVTTLVSAPGNGAFDARYRAGTPDGSHVVFATAEQLAASDANTLSDLYERSGGVTQHVSVGTPGGTGPAQISANGSRVTFESGSNVWQRTGGVTTKITTGTENPTFCICSFFAPRLGGTSEDGTRVFFLSHGVYDGGGGDICGFDVNEDPMPCEDVFEWTAGSGAFRLISNGPPESQGESFYGDWVFGVSADVSRVFFGTYESQTSDDVDGGAFDTYENFGGQLKLISTGPADQHGYGPSDPAPYFVSPDGLTAAFSLGSEAWVSADTDSAADVYVYSHGVMHLASVRDDGANGPGDAGGRGASEDGSRIFFETADQIAPGDVDTNVDVYERIFDSTTDLLATTGTSDSYFAGASKDGTAVVVRTADRLLPSDTDSREDLYLFRAPAGHVRPKQASPMYVSLAPAYQACTAPNRTHGPSLAFASCSPPTRTSSRLTPGTPDANGQPAKAIWWVRLQANQGDPSTPADEADVGLAADMTDVRKSSDLSDYTGELELRLPLRITDKLNGTPGSGTVADSSLATAIPCAATADDTIGGHCSISTTIEAIIPGAVTERSRAVWALDQVRVNDGGPDGSAATQDNDLFAVEGLFVP
jgi:hypothetical protein